eukprot:CAMPEP_0177508828 /NCGR_PEP_ID=MMETSP0369-20130122/41241_1 /TAXON_ID=447022 ORGANISM="Scrippsiella hangoei-like, Strain SHHI-4" /NCGR_SAMPLE_ID=MMETSP0369 /ASSEMBLY_ACC=CAM_ASM_000364 /LENGTH=66 /DNA_ID=CAMNT_0018986977 /DNA_START=69 /DNA_END=268 /DNA_ORIENTATION=-
MKPGIPSGQAAARYRMCSAEAAAAELLAAAAIAAVLEVPTKQQITVDKDAFVKALMTHDEARCPVG